MSNETTTTTWRAFICAGCGETHSAIIEVPGYRGDGFSIWLGGKRYCSFKCCEVVDHTPEDVYAGN